MRQRHIKNLDERLKEFDAQLIADAEDRKGRWRDAFKDPVFHEGRAPLTEEELRARPLYAEVGCGKGQFITKLSSLHPENLYLAVEGQGSVGYYALRKARDAECENVRFVLNYIHDARDFFQKGEIDGLYLNFSDPWPKPRHEKRRLTSPRMLGEFASVVRPGGFIEFKTDNDDLFAYSVEQFQAHDLLCVEYLSDDLHRDVPEEQIVTTEYEDKFSARGKNIHFIRVRVLDALESDGRSAL